MQVQKQLLEPTWDNGLVLNWEMGKYIEAIY